MVTRVQIDKLASRIEAIAERSRSWRTAVIVAQGSESADEAEARHYRDHPEDRSASHTVTVLWGMH